jgi:hypothetical protein
MSFSHTIANARRYENKREKERKMFNVHVGVSGHLSSLNCTSLLNDCDVKANERRKREIIKESFSSIAVVDIDRTAGIDSLLSTMDIEPIKCKIISRPFAPLRINVIALSDSVGKSIDRRSLSSFLVSSRCRCALTPLALFNTLECLARRIMLGIHSINNEMILYVCSIVLLRSSSSSSVDEHTKHEQTAYLHERRRNEHNRNNGKQFME